MRFATRAEARAMIELGKQYTKEGLPPHIVAHKRAIELKIRNAELFMARTGAIDYGMINEIVRMKLQLDGLYMDAIQDAARDVTD
jgi:hypothetical protein